MSKQEENTLIALMKEINTRTEKQHEIFTKSIEEIQLKLDSQTKQLDDLKPVADVYKAFAGFGSIAKGFLTWVVIPLSVVFGLFLTIKNVFK